MLFSTTVTNKQYSLTDRQIQNLTTEFYGTITKQTKTYTSIDFDDVTIEYVSGQTACIDGETLSKQFERALSAFKK